MATRNTPSAHLTLKTKSDRDETSTPNPDDSWDRADTHTTWDILGIELSDKAAYASHEVDFPVAVGDVVHAVYCIWSTGDSFGHDQNNYCEVVTFHKNSQNAMKNRDLIEADNKLLESNHSYIPNKPKVPRPATIDLVLDSGIIMPLSYRPWDGYFESLSSVEIATHIVVPAGLHR